MAEASSLCRTEWSKLKIDGWGSGAASAMVRYEPLLETVS
jgi:hypothetical protein